MSAKPMDLHDAGADAPCTSTPITAMATVAALWPEAKRIAARRCRNTLYRLRRGEGGFYDHDDLWQDLFLEFWALLQRPSVAALAAEGRTLADEPLRLAWSKALWGGGMRILRRAPQRLWHRFEEAVEPVRLDGGDYDGDGEAERHDALPIEALVGEDGARTASSLARLAAIRAALWRLRPAQRQALYMAALQGLPEATVARRLGLASANAVAQRIKLGRQRLAADEEAHDG